MSDSHRDLMIVTEGADGRPGGSIARLVATTVVVFCTPVVCLVALAGLFADGANLFERIVVGVLNPLAVIPTAWAMLEEDFWHKFGSRVTVVAGVALVANLIASVALAVGWSEGDFEIPLILAIPFAMYVGYRAVVRIAAARRS